LFLVFIPKYLIFNKKKLFFISINVFSLVY